MNLRNYCFLILILFCFCGCTKQKQKSISISTFPIYLEMPQNITVFENIGPTLYESLYHQFQRSGYSIVEKRRDAFCLKTKIDSFNDSSARFISLDVVPYLFRVEIVIKCELFDKNEKLIAKKEFKFSKWFSRPKDAILDPKFLKYQYTELLNRAVIKIDQYFKKYLLKDFQKS